MDFACGGPAQSAQRNSPQRIYMKLPFGEMTNLTEKIPAMIKPLFDFHKKDKQ